MGPTTRPKVPCPMCDESLVNLPRHLREVHRYSETETVEIMNRNSTSIYFHSSDPEKKLTLMACSLCHGRLYRNLYRHLLGRKHKLRITDDIYKQILAANRMKKDGGPLSVPSAGTSAQPTEAFRQVANPSAKKPMCIGECREIVQLYLAGSHVQNLDGRYVPSLDGILTWQLRNHLFFVCFVLNARRLQSVLLMRTSEFAKAYRCRDGDYIVCVERGERLFINKRLYARIEGYIKYVRPKNHPRSSEVFATGNPEGIDILANLKGVVEKAGIKEKILLPNTIMKFIDDVIFREKQTTQVDLAHYVRNSVSPTVYYCTFQPMIEVALRNGEKIEEVFWVD